MPEFLKLIPPKEALDKWLKHLPENQPLIELVDTTGAAGRVIAEDITALHPLPAFPRSTVDGYAVQGRDTFGASDSLPAYFLLVGEVMMGSQPDFKLIPGSAALIHTGGMIPENADAVIMLEYTQTCRSGEIEVTRAVAPLENILQVGEDVQTGQVVICKGTHLRSAEIGGLLAFGIRTIKVAKKPVIGIISSGDEVVPPEVTPMIGQVRDINSSSLSSLVTEFGGETRLYGIVPDNASILKSVLNSALAECDGVIITAGSSASSRDITSQIIQEAGQPGVVVHGINVKPGKPAILAVYSGKPVIGLPGNPVSALVIAWLFIPPLFERMLGQNKPTLKNRLTAKLTINVPSLAGREDWVPVKITQENGDYLAEPIFFKSNLIFNLVSSDGLMHIPADANGVNAGEFVQVFFL
jgi:molybdopterin molybdotransferase